MKTDNLMIKNKGFTLIELLIVIAITGILSSVILVALSSAREKSKIAKAQIEIRQIYMAMEILRHDTEYYSNHVTDTPCVQGFANNEVYINDCKAGILCNDGSYANWKGPYMASVPKDPWGSDYLFDSDYTCHPAIKGCEGVADNTPVRALVSFGPDRVGLNMYNDDDIIKLICK